MSSQFSKDGIYYAHLTSDGKLRIWNTVANSFEQEFTPNFHLTSPCTCLHFVHHETFHKSETPRKKKRRSSSTSLSPNIVLGTTTGLLLNYSIAKGNVEYTVNSEIGHSITCLSLNDDTIVYSGAEQTIIVWNLKKQQVIDKWNSGKEKITAILAVPARDQLLTASKIIKLWDIKEKEIIRSFTGHSSEISFLHHIYQKSKIAGDYFISASKNDRLLSCWNIDGPLEERNATTNFLLEDVAQNISINVALDGSTNIATTIRSGVVHIFSQLLNGRCNKPLKPKTTIHIASDTREHNVVKPIHIVGSFFRDDSTLSIGYGGDLVKTFENITISNLKKIECLVRQDPQKISQTHKKQENKIIKPEIGNDVHYLTLQTSSKPVTTKRKSDGRVEVPMEKRLENLTLNRIDENKVPKSDNVAQLLVQGLHSKDKVLLRTALYRKDELTIQNTVKRLPMSVIVPLAEELLTLIGAKTLMSEIGALWLRHLLSLHASVLLSNPDLSKLLTPILGSIETRLSLQTPLNRLKGRLDLLMTQINLVSMEESKQDENALLIYNDKDSSDSENEFMELDHRSDSDNEWTEESDQDENFAENHDSDASVSN